MAVGPIGPPEIDGTKVWEALKTSRAQIFLWGTILFYLVIVLVFVRESMRSGEPGNWYVLDIIFAMAAVLLLILALMGLISMARKGPSPAVFTNGVLLVQIRPFRLITISRFYPYEDLKVPRRTIQGLEVRSSDGLRWTLLRGIFGDEWLTRIEERILRAHMGRDPPRIVRQSKTARGKGG